MREMEHPNSESLQGYAEGAIGESDRAVLDSHLLSCTRCRTEVDEWRSLFATLAELPQFAPSTEFAVRVLSRVHVGSQGAVWSPWLQGARQLVQRITPTTRAGWSLATAFLMLPLLVGGGLVAWLFSKDYITAQSLWLFVTDRATSSMQSLGAAALKTAMESGVTSWLLQQGRNLLATLGMRGVGALAAGVGGMTMLSTWILYRNLFRTPTRETNHALHSF